MRLRRLALIVHVAATAMAAGCSSGGAARDQWTVWIATDVPVPNVVDRALVETLSADGELACADCRRLIGLPTSPADWPISFGVVAPPSGVAPRVRVRLYQAVRVGPDGVPPVATTIDRVAMLPPAHGNTDVALVLHGECAGLAANVSDRSSCSGPSREMVDEAVLSAVRPDAAIVPGSWSRSIRRPCTLEPDDDMVCVPGGLFVLGDPLARSAVRFRATPERFVTVDPFAMDREEVKVGTVRSLLESGKIADAPVVRSSDPTDAASQCTYVGPRSAENDALPVNCIDHSLAAKVCSALGKRLPTEVEWEWAAGNLEDETSHPWGSEGDACVYSDVGLGYDGLVDILSSPICRTLPGRSTVSPGLPLQGNPRDRSRLGLLALGGGVSEWVADRAANYEDACWRPEEAFLENPRCDAGSMFTIRGSSWLDTPGFAHVANRQGAESTFSYPSTGFRCARSE